MLPTWAFSQVTETAGFVVQQFTAGFDNTGGVTAGLGSLQIQPGIPVPPGTLASSPSRSSQPLAPLLLPHSMLLSCLLTCLLNHSPFSSQQDLHQLHQFKSSRICSATIHSRVCSAPAESRKTTQAGLQPGWSVSKYSRVLKLTAGYSRAPRNTGQQPLTVKPASGPPSPPSLYAALLFAYLLTQPLTLFQPTGFASTASIQIKQEQYTIFSPLICPFCTLSYHYLVLFLSI